MWHSSYGQQTTSTTSTLPPVSTTGTTPVTNPNFRRAQWFTVGAKLAYNVSLAEEKSSDRYDIQTSLRHGGSVGIYMRLGTNVYCQPEVLYTFGIYNQSRTIDDDNLQQSMQTHTIDLPVLLGYSPLCSETFKIRLMAGPRFAFNVNVIDKYKLDQETVKQYETFLAVSTNKARLGLDCGIGFDIWRISIDLRYNLMQDVFKYQVKDFEENEWKSVNFLVSTFHIAVGYNIWGNNMPSSRKQKYDPSAYDFFKKK